MLLLCCYYFLIISLLLPYFLSIVSLFPHHFDTRSSLFLFLFRCYFALISLLFRHYFHKNFPLFSYHFHIIFLFLLISLLFPDDFLLFEMISLLFPYCFHVISEFPPKTPTTSIFQSSIQSPLHLRKDDTHSREQRLLRTEALSFLDAQNRAVGELLLQRKGTVWFGEEFFRFWNLVVELGPGRFVFVGH